VSRFRFWDAGSYSLVPAGVSLDIDEKGRRFAFLVFGRYWSSEFTTVARSSFCPRRLITLLMESTYGDKSHEDPRLAFEEFRKVVSETIQRGGKVIIPFVLQVGRTQEIGFLFERNDERRSQTGAGFTWTALWRFMLLISSAPIPNVSYEEANQKH